MHVATFSTLYTKAFKSKIISVVCYHVSIMYCPGWISDVTFSII